MRAALGMALVTALASGCVEGTLAHYQAKMEHLADCQVRAGVEECAAPGASRKDIQSRMTIDERGEHTRVFMLEETLVGPMENNSLHVISTHEQVRDESGCLTRQTRKLDGVIDEPGFGMRRELVGTLETSNVTDGDPQQCGQNVPYGQISRYRVVALEVFNP